jgi:hypothetical protein
MLETARAAVPLFVRVIVCAELALLTAWLAKVKLVGERAAATVVDTVIAIEPGLTVPANVLVVSVTVALSESVGLLAVA